MTGSVCTLFEGDFHYGLAALVNSLYIQGFRGTIWAGFRGKMPPWAIPLTTGSGWVAFKFAEGCDVRFVHLDTKVHFTNYKPTFIKQVWSDFDSNAKALFYFDPDIVVRCRWSFFEEWVECGVALCQEITNSNLPSDHPFRFKWKTYVESLGFGVTRQLNQLFNGGFLGLAAKSRSCLDVWEVLIQGLATRGMALDRFSAGDATCAFNATDQPALNMMAMVTDWPLSTVGPEEMDFLPGGSYMSHATGSPKPWRKRYIPSALSGIAPSRAEKAFWRFTQSPVRLFTPPALLARRIDLVVASAISRFIRRN